MGSRGGHAPCRLRGAVIAFRMRNPTGLLLLFVVSLGYAQANNPTSAPASRTTYHDDAMGFDFAYPSTFHPPKTTTSEVPSKEQDKVSGDKKAEPECVTSPIGVMDMRTDFDMIFL